MATQTIVAQEEVTFPVKAPSQQDLSEQVKAQVDSAIVNISEKLRQVNRTIWENPELAFEEHKAHETLCDALEELGFAVTRHAYGLETAFEARSGSGGRLVNFNAEYDALPNIGHACGHNLIATCGLTAFLALSFTLKKFGIEGRTQLLGTPAEEIGGGKIELLKAGAYEGVDVSLMAHPGTHYQFAEHQCSGAAGVRLLAKQSMYAGYKGKNAHSGANPWNGINALDAVVAGYNNISMLRQSMRPNERVHGAIMETPSAANIIAAHTKVCWETRAPTRKDMERLSKKVVNCLEAAAHATGCGLDLKRNEPYSDLLVNEQLCDRYQKHMLGYGEKVLKVDAKFTPASSDIGDISYALPTMHPLFGIPVGEKGIVTHHPAFTAAAGTDEAHDAAVKAGKALGLIGWDILTDDSIFETVRSDWVKATAAALGDEDDENGEYWGV